MPSWPARRPILAAADLMCHKEYLTSVGIRELRQRASELIRQVERRVTYLDSSAIVKLVVREPESVALRSHLRRRPLVSSLLARTEVIRALLPRGDQTIRRGLDVLSTLDLVRVDDRRLTVAGELQPTERCSLGAIHLATAQQFEAELNQIVTDDDRMAVAACARGIRVAAPE